MPGHRDDIECVVFVLIEQFGGAAAHFARAQAEIASTVPNTLPARTWNEIADAIARPPPGREIAFCRASARPTCSPSGCYSTFRRRRRNTPNPTSAELSKIIDPGSGIGPVAACPKVKMTLLILISSEVAIEPSPESFGCSKMVKSSTLIETATG